MIFVFTVLTSTWSCRRLGLVVNLDLGQASWSCQGTGSWSSGSASDVSGCQSSSFELYLWDIKICVPSFDIFGARMPLGILGSCHLHPRMVQEGVNAHKKQKTSRVLLVGKEIGVHLTKRKCCLESGDVRCLFNLFKIRCNSPNA